jgi:hypothetical protein
MEVLRRRRELVILSAELQRATFVRRLERIQANPARAAIGAAAKVASRPMLLKLGMSAFGFALRAYRKRSHGRRKKEHH